MKDFIEYKEALELKQLGFDEPCFTWYWDDIGLYKGFEYGNHNKNPNYISAPLYQQAFRWFRKNYKLGAIVSQFGWGIENEFGQIIYDISDEETPLCYEEAELACLKKLVEIVKNGK